MKCKSCKEFNEESEVITITEVRVQGKYYNYQCQIKHCPSCGELLDKYAIKTC